MVKAPLSDADFAALFDAAPGIYLVLDTDFNMVAANEARLQATMTTREAILGRNLFEVFPDNPDDPAADGVRNLKRSLERVLQSKLPDAMAVQKYDIPRPEAEGGGFEVRYWSPLNTPVLGADGAVKYIIHRVEDVTDFMLLKEREANLQSHADRIENEIYQRAKEVQEANRKLETANAELGRLYAETQELSAAQQRFFSQVSHELRTPLTLILGPVEMLLADGAGLSALQRRNLEGIGRNARTLLRHVNDLLDVVKYRAGAFDVAYAHVDLSERLRVATAHFDSASTGRQLLISVHAPEHVEAEADPEKVDRILLNLLSNAYKFTPDGGEIDCSLTVENGGAVFRIADTGPGVPVALRESVFEPFRQGDEGLTRRASGTGLGLAIVKDFVTLHGGAIRVLEGPKGGAMFECRLPLRAPAGAVVADAGAVRLDKWNFQQAIDTHARVEPSANANADAPLILIVEDNRDMAEFIDQSLSANYRIAKAQNGKEGLAQAEALLPDLIITDLMMPEMSGDQLVAALSHHPRICDIPVLMLTARADEETRIDALRRGVSDFLPKPFSVDELRARVDKLARAKRAADVIKRDKQISDQKYAQLMDGARDGVFILNKDGLILDANRQGAAFCAQSPASLIGTHLDRALAIDTADAPLNLDSRNVFDLQRRADADGQVTVFEASSAAVAIEGEAYRLVIVRDVTGQRQLEAQIRRMQKLDALGQLTGGIAHDFNNLLTVVVANAEALLRRLEDRPDAHALAANIERAADNGAAMTRRLLVFAGQREMSARECDVKDVVTNAVEMLKRTLPSTITIETHFAPDSAHVNIDPTQLEDALLNLAINARDAMPSGGALSFETGEEEFALADEPGPARPFVFIKVSDTGQGIPAHVMQRVFEPFFTTKGEGKGTGLGLSMVYGFARQAGGDVRIVSVPGQGTQVAIYFPRAADMDGISAAGAQKHASLS